MLDVGWQPWHVEMVQRLEATLRIDTRAHFLRRADQDLDAPGVDIGEQRLLLRRLLVVVDEGDFGLRDAAAD